MKPKVIKTEAEYEIAFSKVESLMDAAVGSKEADELELWAVLVENYEQEHHPIDLPDPVEAICFRMEQQGLQSVDLVRYFNSKSRVSEVLGRKRPLTLSMIRALSVGLHIPAEVLIREPRIVRSMARKRATARPKRKLQTA